MADLWKAMVEELFAEHRGALRAFFYRRVRNKADVADLTQEVYLRMLSAPDKDSIRNPRQYLYAVASNLAKAQRALDSRRAQEVTPEEPTIQKQLGHNVSFDADLDTAQRLSRLCEVIAQLPTNCRIAVVLQYRYELKYAQIGEHLGVSAHSVKKYLARAMIHCRQRMAKLG